MKEQDGIPPAMIKSALYPSKRIKISFRYPKEKLLDPLQMQLLRPEEPLVTNYFTFHHPVDTLPELMLKFSFDLKNVRPY